MYDNIVNKFEFQFSIKWASLSKLVATNQLTPVVANMPYIILITHDVSMNTWLSLLTLDGLADVVNENFVPIVADPDIDVTLCQKILLYENIVKENANLPIIAVTTPEFDLIYTTAFTHTNHSVDSLHKMLSTLSPLIRQSNPKILETVNSIKKFFTNYLTTDSKHSNNQNSTITKLIQSIKEQHIKKELPYSNNVQLTTLIEDLALTLNSTIKSQLDFDKGGLRNGAYKQPPRLTELYLALYCNKREHHTHSNNHDNHNSIGNDYEVFLHKTATHLYTSSLYDHLYSGVFSAYNFESEDDNSHDVKVNHTKTLLNNVDAILFLTALYNKTEMPKYIIIARRIADFLIESFSTPYGLINAFNTQIISIDSEFDGNDNHHNFYKIDKHSFKALTEDERALFNKLMYTNDEGFIKLNYDPALDELIKLEMILMKLQNNTIDLEDRGILSFVNEHSKPYIEQVDLHKYIDERSISSYNILFCISLIELYKATSDDYYLEQAILLQNKIESVFIPKNFHSIHSVHLLDELEDIDFESSIGGLDSQSRLLTTDARLQAKLNMNVLAHHINVLELNRHLLGNHNDYYDNEDDENLQIGSKIIEDNIYYLVDNVLYGLMLLKLYESSNDDTYHQKATSHLEHSLLQFRIKGVLHYGVGLGSDGTLIGLTDGIYHPLELNALDLLSAIVIQYNIVFDNGWCNEIVANNITDIASVPGLHVSFFFCYYLIA